MRLKHVFCAELVDVANRFVTGAFPKRNADRRIDMTFDVVARLQQADIGVLLPNVTGQRILNPDVSTADFRERMHP